MTEILFGYLGRLLNRSAITASYSKGVTRTLLLAILIIGRSVCPGSFAVAQEDPREIDVTQQFTIRSWGIDDGLPSTFIRKIIQDSAGALWLATKEGVARFDGVEFTSFHQSFANEVDWLDSHCLAEDLGVGIWIGTRAGFWLLGDDGSVRRGEPLFNSGLPGEIRSICRDLKEGVWVASARGVSRVRGPDMDIDLRIDIPSGEEAFACEMDSSGRLWIGSSLGVRFYDPKSDLLSPVESSKYPGPANVKLLLPLNGGLIAALFGDVSISSFTLTRREGNRWQPFVRFGDFGAYTLAKSVRGEPAVLLGHGDGFIYLGDETIYRCGPQLAITNPWVESLFEDRAGNIWASYNQLGLVGFFPKLIEQDTVESGLPTPTVWALDRDSKGTIWLAHELGVSVHVDGEWEPVLEDSKSQITAPRAIRCATDGRVWAGGPRGLWVGTREGLEKQPIPGVEGDGNIRGFLQDDRGAVWVFGSFGACVFENGDPSQGRMAVVFDHLDVTAMGQIEPGSVHLGTASGQFLQFNLDALTAVPIDIAVTEHGEAWVQFEASPRGGAWLASESGLYFYSEAGLRRLSFEGALDRETIVAIEASDEKMLWIAGHGGLFAVQYTALIEALRSGRAVSSYSRLSEFDGLLAGGLIGRTSHPSVLRLENDERWWIGRAGINRVSAAPDLFNAGNRIVLESVETQNQIFPISVGIPSNDLVSTDSVNLPAGSGAYVGVSFLNSQLSHADAAEFQYRLQRSSASWIDLGRERDVRLFGLGPGRHVLELRQRPGTGRLTQATKLNLNIEPFLFQRPVFQGAVLAVLLAISVFLYRSRAAYLRRISQLEERNLLARGLHDSLGAHLLDIQELAVRMSSSEGTPIDLVGQEDTPTVGQRLAASSNDLFEAIQELMWIVKPSDESLSGLFLRVAEYGQGYARRHQLACRIEIPEGLPEIAVDITHRQHVFLASKEIMTNVVKHAQATQLFFRFRYCDGKASVEIEDNGSGRFSSEKNGNGLKNIEWRMVKVGGQVILGYLNEGGYRVSLNFPIR